MLRNDAVYSPEMKSRRSPVSRRGLFDFWDLLAVIVVIVLVAHIWPVQQSASNEGGGHIPEVEIDSVPTNITKSSIRALSSDTYQQQSWEVQNSSESEALDDPYARASRADTIIDRLAILQLDSNWSWTVSQLSRARADLARLVSLGDTAVSAIRRYLRTGKNAAFASDDSSDSIGYPSLRLALFDVLRQIGGRQAEAIWFEELHVTNLPVEIATLGRYLNEYSPGLYNQEIVTAAREILSEANAIGNQGRDMAPLFQVFQDYGDRNLVATLEQVPDLWWGRYAALTLAALPDGAGLPSLHYRLAQSSPRTNFNAQFALKLLAQSSDYPEAQEALLENVRNNEIPETMWPEIADIIAGNYRFQMENIRTSLHTRETLSNFHGVRSVKKTTAIGPAGDQVIYRIRLVKPQLDDDQLSARLALLDTLLYETSSSEGKRALERAYETVWSLYEERGEW